MFFPSGCVFLPRGHGLDFFTSGYYQVFFFLYLTYNIRQMDLNMLGHQSHL